MNNDSGRRTRAGIDRRRFLSASGVSVGALAMMAAQAGAAEEGSFGPKRKLVSAVGGEGASWLLPVHVGAADAAKMVGWDYQRIVTKATPEEHINAIRQAVTTQPDVLITVDWYQNVASEVKRAQEKGITVSIFNALNYPDQMAPLNVPFAGQNEVASGITVGKRLAQVLLEKGRKEGSVLSGNPFPASAVLTDRIKGVATALEEANKANGTSFKSESFVDRSYEEPAAAVALYKAKQTELGDVVAHAVVGGEWSIVPLATALKEQGVKPGDVPIGCWDNSDKVMSLLRQGVISVVDDQGFYAQGFLSVLAAWAGLERGMGALRLDTGGGMIDQATLEAFNSGYDKVTATAKAYGIS